MNTIDLQPSAAMFETAAQHASRRVPVATPEMDVDEFLATLRGHAFDSAAAVAVCEAEQLVGLVTMEGLLAAPARAVISEVMDPDAATVTLGVDQEQAAWKAVGRGEATLAVVDDRGRFQGLIPPRRMLAVLLEEHDEDLARLGGFLRSTRTARRASEEPLARRLVHRLPWLMLGLVGAMVSALLVGAFEGQLKREVVLAFFVPGVVYMADAVGTQTEALIIRGLSVGVSVRQVVYGELVTGGLVGLLLSALFMPLALIVWGQADVAAAVAVALLAACSIATVIALALPWLFSRLGRDPAFGSGPLATVVQDLLSILIYFAAASALVN